MLKLNVKPELEAPSTVKARTLLVSDAENEGVIDNSTLVQEVWLPDNVAVAEPKTWPELERKLTVTTELVERALGTL